MEIPDMKKMEVAEWELGVTNKWFLAAKAAATLRDGGVVPPAGRGIFYDFVEKVG
jgi:hypothetical protein